MTQPSAQPATPVPPALPYGAPLSLATARSVLAAAQAEARKNNWNVTIAIVDSGGHPVLLERLDLAPFAGVEVAVGKARTAVAFRRPSKAIQDIIAAGGEGLRMLGLPGAVPIDGGTLLISGGAIVGGIGVSGVTSPQDGQIARAGADSLT